jgi:hypothetical protein
MNRIPLLSLPGNAESLESKPSRHAWGLPQSLSTIGQPRRWIEPMRSRDDAISEAKRIAEEESAFGCGFAWEYLGRWYAADVKPLRDEEHGIGFGEVVTVEIGQPVEGRNACGLY